MGLAKKLAHDHWNKQLGVIRSKGIVAADEEVEAVVALRPVDQMSAGEQEQIYFATRLALAELESLGKRHGLLERLSCSTKFDRKREGRLVRFLLIVFVARCIPG